MTDLELMELAAKAVGNVEKVSMCGWITILPDGSRGAWWDPLTDDGDAFRLAAALELDVMHRVVGGKRIEALSAGGPLISHFYEDDSETCKAVRYTIVRTAAQITLNRKNFQRAFAQFNSPEIGGDEPTHERRRFKRN